MERLPKFNCLFGNINIRSQQICCDLHNENCIPAKVVCVKAELRPLTTQPRKINQIVYGKRRSKRYAGR